MARVMMYCGGSGKHTFTGIESEDGKLPTVLETQSFQCAECGRSHRMRNLFLEGVGPSDVDTFWVALDLLPDVAAEVGTIISLFASIEHRLPELLHYATGLGVTDCWSILGSLEKFGDKTAIIKRVIQRKEKKGVNDDSILALLALMSEAQKLRNLYAHGTYGIGRGDDLYLQPFASDKRKAEQPALQIKSLAAVIADSRRMREITSAVCRAELQEVS